MLGGWGGCSRRWMPGMPHLPAAQCEHTCCAHKPNTCPAACLPLGAAHTACGAGSDETHMHAHLAGCSSVQTHARMLNNSSTMQPQACLSCLRSLQPQACLSCLRSLQPQACLSCLRSLQPHACLRRLHSPQPHACLSCVTLMCCTSTACCTCLPAAIPTHPHARCPTKLQRHPACQGTPPQPSTHPQPPVPTLARGGVE